jgi:hypothetical protein
MMQGMSDIGRTDSVPCWACGARIEPSDAYCRRCGKGQGSRIPWYYRNWGIAVSSLLGLGPFGLILVWRSPALGPKARWAWTAAILLLTGCVVLQIYRAYCEVMRQLPELMGMLR